MFLTGTVVENNEGNTVATCNYVDGSCNLRNKKVGFNMFQLTNSIGTRKLLIPQGLSY